MGFMWGDMWGDGGGIPPEDRAEYERRERERMSKQGSPTDDGIGPEAQFLSPEEVERRWEKVIRDVTASGNEVGSIFS